MGFRSIVKGAAGGGALLGGGGALTGGLLGGAGKDLLLGKKDKGRAAGFLGLDPSLAAVVEKARKEQAQLMDVYGQERKNLGKVDAEAAAAREQSRLIGLARQQGEDQRLRAREQMARSGTQKSAVGMRALMGAENQALKRIKDIRASAPEIIQKQQMNRLQRLSALTGGLGTTLSTTGAAGTTRAYDTGRSGGGRSGGLLGLGMGLAGMAMSPKDRAGGFQAGAGAGKMAANL